MSTIDDAIAALRANSIAEPRVGPPPSDEQIATAESQLGCKFPPSYVRFLAEGGAYQLPFWQPYWVGPCEREDIVEANRREREEAASPLPEYLVSFHNNSMGDQLCFDARSPDEQGEYPVVFWDHEISAEENIAELEPVATTSPTGSQRKLRRPANQSLNRRRPAPSATRCHPCLPKPSRTCPGAT